LPVSSSSISGVTAPRVPEALEACKRPPRNSEANLVQHGDRAVHDWYRFVLSFPPHLVRDYCHRFGLGADSLLLDPFCGTGTTLVEAKREGIPSVGVEAHPFTAFVARTKVDWSTKPLELRRHARGVAKRVLAGLEMDGIQDEPSADGGVRRIPKAKLRRLPPGLQDLNLLHALSPLPLHKALALRDQLEATPAGTIRSHELVAFAKSIVFSSSNLRFGPEVGLGRIQEDAAVVGPWLSAVESMASDLEVVRPKAAVRSVVLEGDSRSIGSLLQPRSVDAVVTSPPYPNEKDYTRTTRLESVLLGYVRDKEDLRRIKKSLVRSNTRGVFKADDDDAWVSGSNEINRIAAEIEARRIELGKTSGFERLYHRVAKLYFGGMHRHLAHLRPCLKPGARLAYVVGDQASYLRILIRTGTLLGEIAGSLGYELEAIDLFRTRLATATKVQLREEVVVLRWPGSPARGRIRIGEQ
jgi:hypothetical protein